MTKAEKILLLVLVVFTAFMITGCKKKPPIEPAPTAAPPAAPVEQEPAPVKQTEEGGQELEIEEITRLLQPVFYDFDKSDIRSDQVATLQSNARVLKENPTVSVLIEGHCDERGTEEYNLALGERRANASKDYLASLGIAENRMSIISYGESRPFATGHNEDSWKLNRRAHFVAVKK